MTPNSFQRLVDLQGRLRLPDFLLDDYQECVISLGMFSNTYLQLTPDGIYMIVLNKLSKADILDLDSFRMQMALRQGHRLRQDKVGRIKLPLDLLEKVGIKPGNWVEGKAVHTYLDASKPSYWTLAPKDPVAS